MIMDKKIIAYCDGGARGNPGPAAIGIAADLRGFTPLDKLSNGASADSRGIKEYSEYIGRGTNNEAEYQAILFALKKIKHLIGNEKAKKSTIEIKSDSDLVVNQLNGENKIKEKNLQQLFITIWNLKQDFKKVNFNYISREENKEADRLVNRELDSQKGLF